MKNATRLSLLVGASTLLLAGCWNAAPVVVNTGSMVETGSVVDTGTTDTGAVDTGMVDTGAAMIDHMVTLDTTASKLQWTGKKILGMHTGTVAFSSGSVSLAKNIPVAGMFTINMTTITTDAGEKLITHLKSEDFFNVSGYNTATLKLMKITPASGTNMYDVVAALTIKGITNAITFPAVIVVTDAQVTAKASFTIDRTKWNIKYGSASVFADIGDKAIEDKIGFDVDVILK